MSISDLETALLHTTYSGMRHTMSNYLSEQSKVLAHQHAASDHEVVENESSYRVEGEVGRFTFRTHQVKQGSRVVFDTARDCESYPALHAAEWHRTCGFKELALTEGVARQSYRQTAQHLNRVRHQPGATPARSLQAVVEAEARDMLTTIESLVPDTMDDNRSHSQIMACLCPRKIEQEIGSLQLPSELPAAELIAEIKANPVLYEDPGQTVNISIDDVCAKKQKEKRSDNPPEDDRKRVHTTVSHIQHQSASYTLAGNSVDQIRQFTSAFLQANKLNHHQLRFFTDGQRSLKDAIYEHFGHGPPMGLVLDWKHLSDKCAQLLSLALKGKENRNQILSKLTEWLWLGLVDRAQSEINSIDQKLIKKQDALDQLIGYFERNRSHIPCYALRKKLGLRNSSNLVEKMNDRLVSDRQKHQGMSWSQTGSVALAVITSLKLNQEFKIWFKEKKLNFKLK